eukprot:TRINITY_DN14254_c0_g1_i1.p1 TRINITY_DN14254_c0_g1~~TRINITY_DN14254_c0_g1_i1.p1  ORF type:complete len:511 (-),score=103.12 TRINITY_DN14254_c0_g1_i1:3-1343(-)
MDPKDVGRGIKGDDTTKPYAVIIIFFSVAFLCLSLDHTGVFAWAALKATAKAKGSGMRLYWAFALLSITITLITSNDIVILTITPTIIYFCKFAGVDPMPYLFTQFFSANMWSMFLYTGNPTNIVTSNAYGVSFSSYSKWMGVVAVTTGLTMLAMLFLRFFRSIPRQVVMPDTNPDEVFHDRIGAAWRVIWVIGNIVGLAVAKNIGVPNFSVSAFFALTMLIRDVLVDLYRARSSNAQIVPAEVELTGVEGGAVAAAPPIAYTPMQRGLRALSKGQVWAVFQVMPWRVFPFVIGMFVLVQNLVTVGLVERVAKQLTHVLNDASLFETALFMMTICILVCSIMSNLPMAVLFSNITADPAFAVPDDTRTAAILAIIAAANMGAALSIIGALAGLLWRSIIEARGAKGLTYWSFVKNGLFCLPPVMLATSAVISAVVAHKVGPPFKFD